MTVLSSLLSRLRGVVPLQRRGGDRSILDAYVHTAPSAKNALDIFAGEWASNLPAPLPPVQPGRAGLFDDARIRWANDALGGFDRRSVLELGPLEGGHTYMVEQLGASTVLAIESNTRAFLRCLIVKELLGMRARFVCGDFVEYLRNNQERFDVVLASGVLYHMRNPVELLKLVSNVTDRILLWTHYYAPEIIQMRRDLRPKFTGHLSAEAAGFTHTLHRYEYQGALDSPGFCGGSADHSFWLSREDILAALHHFGFTRIDVGFEAPDHPNGPSFAVAAQR